MTNQSASDTETVAKPGSETVLPSVTHSPVTGKLKPGASATGAQSDAAKDAQNGTAFFAFGRKLSTFFLGNERKQRIRIIQSLLSSLVFLICVGLIVYLTSIHIIEPMNGWILSGGILISNLFFYLALRSGINLRFAEPALSLPQIMAALTWIAGAYCITNEAHGGTLMLVALVLVFGVCNMNQRRARIATTYAVGVMGVVMLFKSWENPQIYPARIDAVYFVFVVTIVPTIAVLGAQLDSMRNRLKGQKADLTQALARIGELATRDELTGLINRRQMQQVLSDHCMLCERQMVGFSLALIDLDYFKLVNDTYGHGVGDEVLRNFSRQATRVLRETDVIARWGGEEFLVMMPNVPPGAPLTGIERLRMALSTSQISQTVPHLRIAFSAGITAYRVGETMDLAIDRADKALYRAKASGRNQLLIG